MLLSLKVQPNHMASKQVLTEYFYTAIEDKNPYWEIYIARCILVWISHMKTWSEFEKENLILSEEILVLLEDDTETFLELCK